MFFDMPIRLVRLQAMLIQHGLQQDPLNIQMVRDFDQLLTQSGVEHQLVETDTGHCAKDWEAETLKFMAKQLQFQ